MQNSLISYPLAVINTAVAGGLIYLYIKPHSVNRTPQTWAPPFKATLPVAVFFFASNVYLVIAPFIAPDEGQNVYESLPYWLHCVVGIALLAAGAVYWLVWAIILPKIGGYELVRESFEGKDGWSGNVFVRVKKE